jgi:transposase
LLLSGLLKVSFIPPVEIRELRDLVRYKKKKTQFIASEKNRMIRFLEDCNIKSSSVVSDKQGVSATKIINDIIDGKNDIIHLLTHVHGKVKARKEDIYKALTGRITPHHQLMLKMIRETIDENEKLITKIDVQIDLCVTNYDVELQLLQTIDGVCRDKAITVISEIVVDMKAFQDEHHLSSLAGLGPGSNESGCKKQHPSHPLKQIRSIGISRSSLGSDKEEAG